MLEKPCIPRYSFGEPTPNRVSELGSDNPTDAENQQERLIKIGWIIGFVDGEGCFSINFIRQPHRLNRRGYKTGFQVAHEFAVNPLRTSKQGDFLKFAECLRLIESDSHLTCHGLIEMVKIAETMNHCKPRTEMIRILRDYTPNIDDLFVGEDIVPSAWRHAGAM